MSNITADEVSEGLADVMGRRRASRCLQAALDPRAIEGDLARYREILAWLSLTLCFICVVYGISEALASKTVH